MAARALNETELIDRYVEPNPHKPGPANARLRDYGYPVWVLIEYWNGMRFDQAAVLRDFEIPAEAFAAVLAYYRANKALIDARVALNVV
jgi:uncharacterized protein (DUF433 family)